MQLTQQQLSIINTAIRTIDIEISALKDLRSGIQAAFAEVVELIHASKGRVVVTGIGKSAIIAQKIVATLNSTGTPALFMHAADAVHGDLGMVQTGDLLLCLSKSGSTAEIKVLLPLVKHRGILVVGMVSQRNSWLAQHADYVLYTPVTEEADPNDLAPTASTTAQMALGDALAVALLALRGFQSTDFAAFHPGGLLGKQLYLRVSDLSAGNERPAVNEEASVQQAILEITSKRLGCTVVLNDSGQATGIITDGDLRRTLEQKGDRGLFQLKAKDIMNPQPKTIALNAMAVEALEKMRSHSITQLLVVDEGRYAGIVHLHDLIREGLV